MTPDQISQLPYRPCVGVMLINAEGEVFVGQRLDRDTDAWQMPQGGVDKGEEPRDAALRELLEETGVLAELWTGCKYIVFDKIRKQISSFCPNCETKSDKAYRMQEKPYVKSKRTQYHEYLC